MKGITKIELFDGVTGKKQDEIIKENMVTDALRCLYEGTSKIAGVAHNKGWIGGGGNNNYSLSNILTNNNINLFLLEEQQDPVLVPKNYKGKLIGEANGSYSGTNKLRGNLNLTETINLANGKRFVFDFATDKANGNINCISLSLKHTAAAFTASPYTATAYIDILTDKANAIKPYNTGSNGSYRLKIDLLKTNKLKNFGELDNTIVDLFIEYNNNNVVVNSFANNISYITYNKILVCIDYITGELLGQINASSLTTNGSNIITGLMANIGGSPTFCCLYVANDNVTVKLFDGITSSTIGTLSVPLTDNRSSLLLTNGWSSPYVYNLNFNEIDIDNNTVRPVNRGLALGDYFDNLGICLTREYVSSPQTLMRRPSIDGLPFTINNLAIPVTKLSTQTMKITYEITT